MNDRVSIVFDESALRSVAYMDGEQIGECEVSIAGEKWVISHTGVRPEFGGQGIAGRLLDKVIDEARARGVIIIPLCSYAEKKMAGKEEYKDVL